MQTQSSCKFFISPLVSLCLLYGLTQILFCISQALTMARYSFVFSAMIATAVAGDGAAYAQCGGNGFTGATTCVSGYHCQFQNDYYSQCIPGSAAVTTKAAAPTKATGATTLMTVRTSGRI